MGTPARAAQNEENYVKLNQILCMAINEGIEGTDNTDVELQVKGQEI